MARRLERKSDVTAKARRQAGPKMFRSQKRTAKDIAKMPTKQIKAKLRARAGSRSDPTAGSDHKSRVRQDRAKGAEKKAIRNFRDQRAGEGFDMRRELRKREKAKKDKK
jgi:hypothetical protein